MSSHRSSAAPAAISPMAWTLIGLTVAYLAAYLVVRSQTPPGGYHPQWIPDVFETAALFGLAAALVVGGDRWAAGRSWMRRAVPLFVVAGLLQAFSQGFLAWQLADTTRISVGLNPYLMARAFLEVGILAVALAFLAMGLWVSRPPGASPATASHWAVVAIGTLALVAIGAEIAYGVATALNIGGDRVVIGATWSIVGASVPLALAFVAMAALGHRPLGRHLPELAIAIGSLLVLTTDAVLVWAALVLLPSNFDIRWSWLVFGVPTVARSVGWLMIVGAVAIGRWSERRSAPAAGSLAADRA